MNRQQGMDATTKWFLWDWCITVHHHQKSVLWNYDREVNQFCRSEYSIWFSDRALLEMFFNVLTQKEKVTCLLDFIPVWFYAADLVGYGCYESFSPIIGIFLILNGRVWWVAVTSLLQVSFGLSRISNALDYDHCHYSCSLSWYLRTLFKDLGIGTF